LFRGVIGQPSQTALTAAAARAAHLIVDAEPLIFADTLAYDLLGETAEELLAYHRAHGTHPILAGARAAVTTRSRYTEDLLAAAVARGIDQYVILGAGLDSFACRSPLAEQIQVYELDHPVTQSWKLDRLKALGIPPTATFVPADLETTPPLDALTAAGFDPARPAFVGWLGVTMYLTLDAITQTLRALATLAPGSEAVIDYMLPAGLRDEEGRSYADGVGPVAAERGEPWLTFLSPADCSALLTSCGLTPLAHTDQRSAIDPSLWTRTDSLHPSTLSMLAHARTG
jgi:methyltransferase (TIGR00027 family)